MTSVYPVADPLLWLRFAAGVAVLLWLPGHLLVGRFMTRRPRLVRLAMSISAGLLLAPAWSRLATVTGIGVRPWSYLIVALALGIALGLVRSYRNQMAQLDAEEASPRVDAGLTAAVILAAVVLVWGFCDFAAPPHVHDAVNHSFMTLRVGETGSMRYEDVFGPPYGLAELPYLMGMHATASLIAQATGLAPYVSIWFVGLTAVMLMSLPLALLWQEWRFSPAAVAIAALFVASNQFVPAGLLSWGGWGALVGMLLVPMLTLVLVRFWATGLPWLGVWAGVGAGSLLLVHGSELPVVGLVTVLTVLARRVGPCFRPLGWALFLGLLVALGWNFFTAIIPSYLRGAMELTPPPDSLGKMLERALHAGGKWVPLQGLWVLGLILGIRERKWRVVSVAAAAIVALSATLGAWEDPVSKLLSTPFYRQPTRVRYVLLFFMSPLMAVAATWIAARVRLSSLPNILRPIAIAAVLAALVLPPQRGVHRVYADMHRGVPFDADDARHALGIGQVVEPDAWVANGLEDGSAWAMHLSGRRFLLPTWWRLRDARGVGFTDLAADVLREPWPLRVLTMDHRPDYAYATDTRFADHLVYDRARLDADPRFEPVLVGRNSTLYRILWP